MVTFDSSTTRSGVPVMSLPEETEAIPRMAFTDRAFAALSAWVAAILADRCAMRAQLQVANGGKAAPDAVCRPAEGAK